MFFLERILLPIGAMRLFLALYNTSASHSFVSHHEHGILEGGVVPDKEMNTLRRRMQEHMVFVLHHHRAPQDSE